MRGAVVAPARSHNLSVRLQRDRSDFVAKGADIGGDDPVAVKCRIQRSIGVVAHDQEVTVRPGVTGAAHDDLAVGLHNDAH